MASLTEYVDSFRKRGGIAIALSTFLGKFATAFLSIFVVRLVTQEQYSDIAYLLSFYSIFLVFAGFGGNYSLLRFGSISKTLSHKRLLYAFSLKDGVKLTFGLSVLSIAVYSIVAKDSRLVMPFAIMAFGVITFYILEVLKSFFRILELNHVFAKINIVFSLVSMLLVIALTYLLNVEGYFIAILFTPVLVFLFYSRKIKIIDYTNKDVDKKEFRIYGLHTSVSAFANQIIFSIAPILIAILSTDNKEIALFKVATIIPFNILTLPGILMQTDFTALAKNSLNPQYLKDYYKNYLKIFGIISLPFFVLSIYFGEIIIVTLFGYDYIDTVPMYKVFMIATYFSYILRNPIGNILLAVGKAKWNGYNTYAFCILYIMMSFFLYEKFQLYSFVYSLAFVFVFSGVIGLIMFIHYINNINREIK